VDGAVEYLVHWRAAAGGGYTIHSWVTESQKVLYGFADNISVEWWASARNDYAIGTDSETWQFISPGGSSSVSPQSLNRHFTVEGDGVTIVFEEPEPR
jgi:hypothetical protein